MNVFISAGEASGDMHASALIEEMLRQYPDSHVFGIAGPAMHKAGCDALAEMNELNVMGFVDVIKSLPRIHRVRQRVLAHLEKNRPDVAILVDFPGFHINLGPYLRKMGIPVVQYIAPKLWAWGAWRARKLRLSQDRLASILPFEPQWFAKHGIRASYVGNPSAISSLHGWSRAEYMRKSGLPDGVRCVAILPGSRPSELAHHVELLASVWQRLREHDDKLCAVLPIAPGVDLAQLHALSSQPGVYLIDRMQDGYRLYADAAVAVSGTATLELALWDIPTLLVYRTSPFTVFMARRVVGLSYIGLANILLDKAAMPELIQEEAGEENIIAAVDELLNKPEAACKQRSDFSELRRQLGDKQPAVEVVKMATDLIVRKS